jgi:hypothetical protein
MTYPSRATALGLRRRRPAVRDLLPTLVLRQGRRDQGHGQQLARPDGDPQPGLQWRMSLKIAGWTGRVLVGWSCE